MSGVFLKVQSNDSRYLKLPTAHAFPSPHACSPPQDLSQCALVRALIANHALSPLPLQIKQPCGGLGNYFLMQSATIAERVFVDPWLISFHCEIYACVKSGGRVLAMFRVHWNASKGQEHFSYVSHVTADGKRESRLSWCVVADLRFPSLMAEGDVGQCKRSTPVGSSSLGILVGLAILTFINKSRAVYIDVPFRSWCSSWLQLCFWRMCFLSAEAA